MSPDEYVLYILQKYAVQTGSNSPAESNARLIIPQLRQWAGSYLVDVFYSGSYAKGTGVLGSADIDIFISLHPSTPQSLGEIYESLFQQASAQGWNPKRQNVSIGITYNGVKIDLVPGKVQSGQINYHSLYVRRRSSWTQTNVKLHIDEVIKSRRVNEIRAIKIWRNLHKLDFFSFYLELSLMNALAYKPTTTVAQNVITALEYLESSFPTARVLDPANTNNVISDGLTAAEKKAIADQARLSRQATNWNQIIW